MAPLRLHSLALAAHAGEAKLGGPSYPADYAAPSGALAAPRGVPAASLSSALLLAVVPGGATSSEPAGSSCGARALPRTRRA